MAQDKKSFTLEDLIPGGKNYSKLQPKNMSWFPWWGDLMLKEENDELKAFNPANGKEETLITLQEVNDLLAAKGLSKLYAFEYSTSMPYEQKWILLYNLKYRALVDLENKEVIWSQAIPEQAENQGWNKVSRNLAFTKGNNLYVADGQGEVTQVTDEPEGVLCGQSVHRNEFGINGGIFWSPKGNLLAFYRMDQSMVTDYPQVDIFPREATYEPDKYPMAGMTSHKVTVGIFDLKTQKTVYLQAGDPTDRYFTNIAWSPDGKTVYMFELNRAQNDCRLVSYKAETGEKIKELCRETSDKYVEPLYPIEFLPWDDSKFILQSQKDGFNHLYLYNVEGQQLKQLTSGPWVVMEFLGFNKKTQSAIILSNEKNPLQKNLYAVNIKTGKRTLLDDGMGVTRAASLSASGEQVYQKYSAPEIPLNIDVHKTSDGKGYQLHKAEDPWKNYQQPIFEMGSIKAADGMTDLYYRMVKPADFDANKKYPTVIYVYGGPHAHNVDASWHWASRSWETYMAQKGYIVFILDNRGSENRGIAFEQATFHQLGQIEMQDQMKGVDYLRTLPYVDMSRLGVHGWSFGGYMTITLMTNYPDVFKVGVAGGPVIDWKWYEVMYGERYMGSPENNAEGYAKCSLIPKARNLKGKLQIITGYNDATVVPQHCLAFLDACIKAGTQPDFFAYPGEPHNMRGHASVHLHERITQYFEDYLK